MQSQLLQAWKLGLIASHGILTTCDMDVYMTTIVRGEARLGTCVES